MDQFREGYYSIEFVHVGEGGANSKEDVKSATNPGHQELLQLSTELGRVAVVGKGLQSCAECRKKQRVEGIADCVLRLLLCCC